MTTIIPALPNDIALQILVRLPRSLHGSFRRVSRAWSTVLHPRPHAAAFINTLRKELHISEAFLVFVSLRGDFFYFVFADIAHHRFRKITCPMPRGAQCSQEHCMAVGSEILMPPTCCTRRLDSEHWLCFDALTMQWKTSISMSTTTPGLFIRSGHASAAMDGYVYAAGGGDKSEVLYHADRMDMSTKKWEALPDMQKGRMCPAAGALKGRLCIIGGSDNGEIHKSGEMWDPENGQWTLLPELWPTHMYTKIQRHRPTVAVVRDRLYALSDDISGDNLQEIMYYEDGSKLWISLGKVCFPSLCAGKFGVPLGAGVRIEMLAVGHELVVLYHERGSLPWSRTSMVIFSTAPNPPRALSWRAWRLPNVVDYEFEPVIVRV